MTSNKGQPFEFKAQNEYEATVLDFLEKEMADVQPAEEKDPQSDELNALVADMLKQVITEAEGPQSLNELVYDKEDDLFAGLTPNLTIAPKPGIDRPTSPPASSPTKPAGPDNTAASQNEPFKNVTGPTISTPLFASESALKGRKPLVMAVVLVCLAAVLGTAGYFFFGSSSKTSAIPKSRPAADQLFKPPTQAVSTPIVQSSANKSAAPTVAAKLNPVPAALVSKPPDSSRQSSIQQSGKPSSPPKEKSEDAPAKSANTPDPVKEEKMAVPPPPPQEPTSIPVTAAAEKPAAAAVPDSSPAVTERKPAQAAPPVSAAPPPSESRNLIAAVPISQTSPAYPELALRTRASGSVVLELQIDEQGKVLKATAVSGPAIFYNAAAAAAMKWRYKPASIGGVNVRSVGKVTMDFNLKK